MLSLLQRLFVTLCFFRTVKMFGMFLTIYVLLNQISYSNNGPRQHTKNLEVVSLKVLSSETTLGGAKIPTTAKQAREN